MSSGERQRRRRVHGSPPGSPPAHVIESVAADSSRAKVSWHRYNEALLEEHAEIGLGQVLDGIDPKVVDWVHFSSAPDPAALRWLHERLELDPLALEDVHNGLQRSKFERYEHHMRISEAVDSLTEVTRSLHELHLMAVSHRMNDVMRLLTIIATIFIPLTFIAGIYGMNFDPDASAWNMPELRARYGYPAVMLLFAGIGVGMAWMFRKRGWF